MSEENQTLNEVVAPSPATNPDDLINTVDEPMPVSSEETQKTGEGIKEEEGKVAEAEKKEAEEKATAQAQEDESRFDKHPRFQELIQSRNELKGQLKDLQAQVSQGTEEPETPDYKDITGLSEDELRQWMDDDPVAYTANLAKQIRAEVTATVEGRFTEKSQEQKVLKTLDDYATNNETFDPMWDSGEIQKFIGSNPGHNAISAHMALTSEGRVKEAVEKAQKETEEKVIKNFMAKKGAQVLGSGPATTGTVQGKVAQELKEPKKFGGVNTVLAARLKARRQAVG